MAGCEEWDVQEATRGKQTGDWIYQENFLTFYFSSRSNEV